MTTKFDIAILGATGAVGETLLEILAERKFDFSTAQICFSAVEANIAKIYAPRAADAGCVVIDKSSQFRYDPDVPLVIPEVNPEALENYRERNIIAVPNCSTIPILVALKPIYDTVGVERMNIATYQSVSGAGKNGIEELTEQTRNLFNNRSTETQYFPVQIAFNVIPHIDDFLDNGYTKEEMKIVWESQKILSDQHIQINPTAVRVPVFYGHSAAVHIETRDKISADEARKLLTESPGIIVIDEQKPGGYPTPVILAENEDAVFVGRIREDISHPLGLDFWVVADNVRKGAALNAVQIAELLIKDYL